jgi:KDO2-lipid IV(A) lauroyltransferase
MGALIAFFRYLPRSVARAVLVGLCSLAFALGIRRRIALANLAIAFPELSARERLRLAFRNYCHLGICAADFLRSPSMSDGDLFALVRPEGWEKVAPLLAARRGFIVATAHLGNFELFGIYAARRKAPLTILTRPLKGSANARWVKTRALGGVREIHKGMENLVAAVRNGEVLALLIDQNMLARRAIFTPFFGRPAATTPAPAIVAQRTGAPVFLAVALRNPDGTYRTHIEGPFELERQGGEPADDLARFTARLNDRLEALIRGQPEQWFWMHRRWKTRPPDEAATGKRGSGREEPEEDRAAVVQDSR